MRIEAVELVRVAMPLVRPFRTSFGVQHARDVLLVHVMTDVGEGWGEAAAHAEPFYNEEFTESASLVLERWLVPAVLGADLRPEDVGARCAQVKGYRAAKAGLEMAVLDAGLRADGVPLARYLGGERAAVDVGVSVGITPTVDELVEQVTGYVADGYRRVKLKVMSGWDREPLRAVRAAHPDLALQVDANAGYTPADADLVASFDEFGLLMVEQPFAPEELQAHADLARRMRTPICLDESILSTTHTATALDLGACSIVNIKVGRVGGLLEARRIHDLCRDRGVPVWCGGMLETGIGRAANVALASLPNFVFPADLSASDRYWRRDLTEPFELHGSQLRVPSGPGLGITVDRDALADLGATVHTIRTVPGASR
ncbi:MAG: o-succinylbenzoate synthase [Actinobacteria bacterium]|uniref:o-succinylbenzoate synthase n=1 Tax=freshwater metagenome TaxID=449393 RepID=A0A6J6BF41_9ZZZZ|nr:o-succinylbenzoate synthase [Actinomycetota bacterium]